MFVLSLKHLTDGEEEGCRCRCIYLARHTVVFGRQFEREILLCLHINSPSEVVKDRAGARTFVGWFFCVDRIGKYIFKIRNNHIPQDTRVHVSLICTFCGYARVLYVCTCTRTDTRTDTRIYTDAQTHTYIRYIYTKPATGRKGGREWMNE